LRFDAKIFTIEEMKDMEKLMMDELHGVITTYEMRIEKKNIAHKEESFKASNKTKG
jgi:hypothetical protein